jgi:predicted phosphoadenosine phosphosulfate sulfurtransferase
LSAFVIILNNNSDMSLDMSVYKIPLNQNVLEAALERITWTLETLPRVCVSFSGGKDSGLMLHLTAACTPVA